MATQPYSKSKPRQPGQPLSAALKGAPANAPNPQDPSRQLAANAPKYGKQVKRAQAQKGKQPANQASGSGSTRLRDTLTPGAMTTVGAQPTVNTTKNARAGQSFTTETRSDKPGVTYHVYVDPKTKKRQVIGVRKAPLKGVLAK